MGKLKTTQARTILIATAKNAVPVILFFLSLTCLNGQADNVAAAKREVLVESDHSWNGTQYGPYPTGVPQLTVLKLTIAANSKLPWHTHPFPNSCYVLSGEITVHDKESGQSATYHQGQAFAESVGRVHRGESGNEPTVLLVTYAGTAGTPTSLPVKGEQAEY